MTRTPPASAPGTSLEMVVHEGSASRLEGRERHPANPIAFAKEIKKELGVQLSDFSRFREALDV